MNNASVAIVIVVVLAAVDASAEGGRLTARGSELMLTTPDGRLLTSRELVGATLRLDERDVTIEAVDIETDARGGVLLLHRFVVLGEDGVRSPLCAPDTRGESVGFPIPDGMGGFRIVCTSGALGKCVRWGYRPWDERPGGSPLRALHAACVRMVRADYGGDGATATRDGTRIRYCDPFGVVACDNLTARRFEAAWTGAGAVCVARPRIPALASLPQLALRYPRLVGRLGTTACTMPWALRDGAVLFSGSP